MSYLFSYLSVKIAKGNDISTNRLIQCMLHLNYFRYTLPFASVETKLMEVLGN